MFVDYVGCKFSRLRWKSRVSESQSKTFIGGTWDNGLKNQLVVWTLKLQNSSAEFIRSSQRDVVGDVSQITCSAENLIATATNRGQLELYSIPNEELIPIKQWADIHDGPIN